MDKKYTLLTVLCLALCVALFIFTFDNEPARAPLEAKTESEPVAPKRKQPEPCSLDLTNPDLYDIAKMDKSLAAQYETLDRHNSKELERRWERDTYGGFMHKRPYAGRSGIGRGTIKHDRINAIIENSKHYKDFAAIPEKTRSAFMAELGRRIGAEAAHDLRFIEARQFATPVTGASIFKRGDSIKPLISNIGVFAVDKPVKGVKVYEFVVLLDESLELIDAEIPEVDGGFNDQNFMDVPEIMEIGKKYGLVSLILDTEINYHDGAISIGLMSLWIPDTDKPARGKFCGGWFDLRTGDLIHGPFEGMYVR